MPRWSLCVAPDRAIMMRQPRSESAISSSKCNTKAIKLPMKFFPTFVTVLHLTLECAEK